MNRHGHNKDICKIFYQESAYKKIGIGIESYYLLTDALMIAIDHSNPAYDKKIFSELERRLGISNTGTNVHLPRFDSLASLGAGTHRYYNHQGFFFEEQNNVKRRKRWLIGRDEILIPSGAAAFNLNVNDQKAVMIACIAYYIHMIGDIHEGSLRSMRQLENYERLLCDFSNSLGATGLCTSGVKSKAFADKIEMVSKDAFWIALTNENPSRAKSCLMRYLCKNVPAVVKELTGQYPRETYIIRNV